MGWDYAKYQEPKSGSTQVMMQVPDLNTFFLAEHLDTVSEFLCVSKTGPCSRSYTLATAHDPYYLQDWNSMRAKTYWQVHHDAEIQNSIQSSRRLLPNRGRIRTRQYNYATKISKTNKMENTQTNFGLGT